MNKTNIKKIWISDNAIFIKLKDGREACELFDNYNRLENATTQQRENYTISYFGIHWPELDEDLSFDGFFKTSNDCLEASE